MSTVTVIFGGVDHDHNHRSISNVRIQLQNDWYCVQANKKIQNIDIQMHHHTINQFACTGDE